MIIGRVSPSLPVASPSAVRPEPVEPAGDGVEVSLVYKGARWPDLNPILENPDRGVAVKQSEQALEAWLGRNIPAADPAEQPFWTGLARWMARDMVDQARPEWERGGLDDYRSGLRLEQPEGAIRGAQGDPEKAVGLFRMLEGFLGEVRFRTRLASFLQSHDGQAATAAELFHALGLEEGQLAGWLDQTGVPTVHARLEGTRVKLSQETEALWSVPVRIRYHDGSGPREYKTFLGAREAEIALPARGPVAWIYPNGGGKGLYATDAAPPPGELARLKPTERLAVLANQARRVRQGAAPVGSFLDQVEATRSDPEPSRLALMLTELDFLAPLAPAAQRQTWNGLVLDQLGPAFERLGPAPRPDEPMPDAELRPRLLGSLCAAGHPGAIEAARLRGERWLAGDSTVTAAEAGFSPEPAVAERILERFRAGEGGDDGVLSLVSNPTQVDRVVERALEGLSPEKSGALLEMLAARQPETAFALLKTRWESLPDVPAMLRASALSPRRAELDRLVAERGTPEQKAAWEEARSRGEGLAELPARLGEWLEARRPQGEWNLAAPNGAR